MSELPVPEPLTPFQRVCAMVAIALALIALGLALRGRASGEVIPWTAIVILVAQLARRWG